MAKDTGPAWGYRWVNGKVVSRLFADGLPARGWEDSPASVKPSKATKNDDDA